MQTAAALDRWPTEERSAASRLVRRGAFVASALPLATAAFVLVVTGWTVTLSLAITPLVVPALIAFGYGVRALAVTEAVLARTLLGAPVAPVAPCPTASGYWRRGWVVLADPSFWRAQAYGLARMLVGFPLAVAELSVLGVSLMAISAPLTYRWIPMDDGPNGYEFVFWRADTFAKALLLVPVGVVLGAIALALLGPLANLWSLTATALLGDRGDRGDRGESGDRGARAALTRQVEGGRAPSRPVAAAFVDPRRALVAHGAVSGGIIVLLLAIWATTTRGYLWPYWPSLALAAVFAGHAWVYWTGRHPAIGRRRGMTRALAIHLGLSAVIELFLIGVWAGAGGGYPWPVWPFAGLAVVAGAHWVAVLTQRIERLDSTRSGAVAVSDTDLRRIERDLHDGAQARLVSLGMNLGLAEQRLAADPEGARELLQEAREGVGVALSELRDLVRGIRPPVLADRGLVAAITALADHSPIPLSVQAEIDERPAGPVETAAYFVVTEALANAAKHGHASHVEVHLQRRGETLRVEVTDDGRGGADPAGSGLTGLRRRVEALDGTLTVTSPAGGPTTIVAELPCGR